MARSSRLGGLSFLLLAMAAPAPLAGADGQTGLPTPPVRTATPDTTPLPPVRLDAVVTDGRGRPILDLTAADFEIRENGVVQKLAGVELRTSHSIPAAAAPPDESPQGEERLARQSGTRVFALVLDEFHVSPGADSDRVRDSLTRFVDERLRPNDLALVLKPLDPLTSLHFTRNREQLHAAIASFAGRLGDDSPRTRFEEQFIGRAPEAVRAARAQIVTAALRELAIRIGDLGPQRAAIVLVSEGFVRPVATGRNARLPDLQGLVRASSRFNLPVYTFNPAMTADLRAAADRATTTLQWLAAQTGGEAVSGGAAIDAGLRRMDEDLTTYYALTYQPSTADGRFHPLEVRTTRANAVVRTRPGYWAQLPGQLRALNSMSSPISRRALKRSNMITAWTGMTRDPDGRVRLIVTWEPRQPNHPLAVLVTARTAAGGALYEAKIAEVGEKAVGTVGDSARFDVPPGRVELDLSVLGLTGNVLDTDSRDVDVPDVNAQKKPFLFAPEIVRARTLPEFRAISADEQAAPSPSRSFGRSDRLLIRASAFDPGGQPLDVTAQVLNLAGQPMRQIDRSPLPQEAIAQFDLPLAWLAPGEYAIEVMARNPNGDVRERVRFTVRR